MIVKATATSKPIMQLTCGCASHYGKNKLTCHCGLLRKCRPLAEVFGRVFVLTGIRGVIKYERERREPLGGLGASPPPPPPRKV